MMNAMPELWPRPAKLKPVTVNTELTEEQQVFAHRVHHHLGTLGAGARRGLYLGEQYALVLVGEERGGNAGEHPDHPATITT